MGQHSKALGLGSEVEFKGQKYKLAAWNFQIQGLFERFLEANAVKAVRRLREYMNEDEYKEAYAQVIRDITAGVYTFGTETVMKALRSVPNLKYLVLLSLQENHTSVKMALVDEMFDEIQEEILAKLNEANADPNPKSPPVPLTDGQ